MSAGVGIEEADIVAGLPAVSVGAILRESGPRLLRDSLGPITVFYAVYKLTHGALLPAVILAAAVAIAAFTWERRQGRAGILARLSLGFVVVQAAVGILSRNPILYFAQPVLIDTVLGLVFIGSVPLGRPIIGATARDAFPFPAEVVQSATFQRVFGRLSLTWGVYFLLRAALRLAVLRTGKIDSIVLINVLSDVPLVVSLMIFTTWYSVRGFRRSEEWGSRLAERAD
ncbi:MAG TPA: VC0807 family protein [Candidatus Dormibacteraeota bacterium]|jgi:intracellular septation protein A